MTLNGIALSGGWGEGLSDNDDGANYCKGDFEGGDQGVIIGYDIICIDEGRPVTAVFFVHMTLKVLLTHMNRRAMGFSGNMSCKH